MEIDFHLSVTYVVSRLAGLDHEQSEIVATCSQYVDDTVNTGVVNFKSGESYNRISSAHDTLDYHIVLPVEERKIWVPFHFLPGNLTTGSHNQEFYNRIVCRPNSEIAKAMLRNCILKQDRPFALHQLGITAHVYIDTWAHQGFAGINHPINLVTDIRLLNPPNKKTFFKVLRRAGLKAALIHVLQPVVGNLLGIWFPMGHGAALHYPDHPFRKWSYKNGHGNIVERNNPQDFLDAADELCKFIRRFILKNPEGEVPGLPQKDKVLIAKLISDFKDEDGEKRNEKWKAAIKEGVFSFGASEVSYKRSGPGSWKYQALGAESATIEPDEKFDFKEEFLTCNWKLFHDAVKAHQFEVLTEILPSYGISAI